jgi:choline kinase
MRAVILAAGSGHRLRPLTDDKPKAMVELRKRAIVQRQIDMFKSAGLSSIIIVGGHGFNALQDTGCTLVKNIDYSKTNMVYSLLCARKYLDNDVVLSYGDILYEPIILETLMRSNHDISVAVDTNWLSYWEMRFDDPLSDAETLRLGKNQELLEIGNKPQGYGDIDAQFMGLMKFNKKGVNDILDLCDSVIAKGDKLRLNLNGKSVEAAYTTDLLNQLILENVYVSAVKVSGMWIEIDTIADFESEGTFQRCKIIDESIYGMN